MTDHRAPLDPVSAAIVGSGLVAILRAPTAGGFSAVADVLVSAGITALEVTLTSKGAIDAIAGLRRQLPAGTVIGAGTVLTPDDARAAVDAGAAFLVSPVLDTLAGQSVPCYPGAYTPTEVYRAHLAGAPLVKLFPAGGLRPGYLKDLRGPLPDVRILPTGGIGLDDITDWLRAGAAAVGLGGPLIGDAATGGSLTALAARAKRALDAVAFARS
ncbi:bifunctional 4-hydroxy-2-oxoglutarate aldolase/2-dehydro-3-deoxy-phosphogluconate aldolase [Actinoplanes teichomyceticus]|uniref:2-dehydro-3-deoxyphosphogluconate aldolase/(4S)-4-hydroxy-2-oxoglutarate aldolase n=1 Tax=Actinoplanes teichomyceticus TaxID=1867 RepID=A0A561VSK3_ACTTI|nr:bifunctional 4-hydroxy-2-oxoglutarate aldolase/2-dehydro-3-deoxy-phosphogluconate aldolase [Actinoplanes teichomyceticus]TWG14578.1 2-dehydro-3-deoxyphosphogluconate aldolase/(4S)-4-hydroxy-2-oxoglutarate aldolase [Actinoplanes teichomyceticus]GIF09982.1 2-keto-3-deoxy-phosphogluconate aldolase [Actinoplanes teichomyceticus]